MMLKALASNYELVVAILVFVIGFCMLQFDRNLLKKVIGLDIMDSGVFLLLADRGYITGRTVPIITDGVTSMEHYVNPIPAGLVLPSIVVSVRVPAVPPPPPTPITVILGFKCVKLVSPTASFIAIVFSP